MKSIRSNHKLAITISDGRIVGSSIFAPGPWSARTYQHQITAHLHSCRSFSSVLNQAAPRNVVRPSGADDRLGRKRSRAPSLRHGCEGCARRPLSHQPSPRGRDGRSLNLMLDTMSNLSLSVRHRHRRYGLISLCLRIGISGSAPGTGPPLAMAVVLFPAAVMASAASVTRFRRACREGRAVQALVVADGILQRICPRGDLQSLWASARSKRRTPPSGA